MLSQSTLRKLPFRFIIFYVQDPTRHNWEWFKSIMYIAPLDPWTAAIEFSCSLQTYPKGINHCPHFDDQTFQPFNRIKQIKHGIPNLLTRPCDPFYIFLCCFINDNKVKYWFQARYYFIRTSILLTQRNLPHISPWWRWIVVPLWQFFCTLSLNILTLFKK